MQVQTHNRHAQSAKFERDVFAPGQRAHVSCPALERFGLPAIVCAHPQHGTHMVKNNLRVGKIIGQHQQVGQLRVVKPGVKTQAELCKLRKALAKYRV